MAAGLPPPPLNSPNGSYYWLEWYTQLTNALNQQGFPFNNLDFTGSDIASIQTRNHNELTAIQGGNASGTTPGSGNAWHMTGKGYVDSGGTLHGAPTGWSIANPSAGSYIVTTTGLALASPNIGAVGLSQTTGVLVQWADTSTAGQITFHLTNPGGTPTNGAFTFIVSS
jgi:hypothetical protein